MVQSFDPKDIKVLSDILALVLDEQPGQAQAALETVRSRARRSGVTGGALKNLFASLASDPERRGNAEREKALRDQITRLEREERRLRVELRTAHQTLDRTQMDKYVLQSELVTQRAYRPYRRMALIFAVGAGLLSGIAATQFYHTLTRHTPVDRAIYLR
ncbi:hypothetical protein [Gluconobacter morbifer]|uniref:Uncharacterized protein n=1 Tax=Gluconobacter morbifer G707 TaxID=1088869 RepID=G6XLD5_9PROT|nr:hypothetical protein [Gluconobacter morbifer]EHH67190.1 hypothetical protein GMO_21830 [Gluconobacter morbifer G707]